MRANNFDLLRLFAASQVVYFHSAENLGVPLDGVQRAIAATLEPFPGVPIFFVISGFLISASLERTRGLRQYFWNRFLRIYPALWVCTLVTLAMLVLCASTGIAAPGDKSIWYGALGKWWVAQVTIAQFYCPFPLKYFGSGHLNGSLWTIPVELQFYMLLPVLTSWCIRDGTGSANRRLFGLLAASYALGAAMECNRATLSSIDENLAVLVRVTVAPYLYMFLFGVIVRANLERLRPIFEGRMLWWLVAYAAYCVFVRNVVGISLRTNLPNLMQMTLLAGLVMSAAFTRVSLSERLTRGNDVSYGVYIYHMVVVNFLIVLGMGTTASTIMWVYAATYAAATISWVSVERPSLRLKRRALHGLQTLTQGGTAASIGSSTPS